MKEKKIFLSNENGFLDNIVFGNLCMYILHTMANLNCNNIFVAMIYNPYLFN